MSPSARETRVKASNKQKTPAGSDSDFKRCIILFPLYTYIHKCHITQKVQQKFSLTEAQVLLVLLKTSFCTKMIPNSVLYILANQRGLFKFMKHKVLIYKGSSIFLFQGPTERLHFKFNTFVLYVCLYVLQKFSQIIYTISNCTITMELIKAEHEVIIYFWPF